MKWKISRETAAKLLMYASRFLLTAILCGAQVFGGYVPFALGTVAAAGGGAAGFSALLGLLGGAMLFLDFSHALRTLAAAILLFAANNAFCELKWYRRKWALPAMTAGLILAVEFVYVLQAGAEEAAYCVLSTLWAGVCAYCARETLAAGSARDERPASSLVLLLGVLMALASPQFSNGFAPGRIAAVLAVVFFAYDRSMSSSLASALGIGLAMDLGGRDMNFLRTASYGLGALAAGFFRHGSRVRAALLFALSTLVFSLPLPAEEGLLLLYEGLAGTLAFLLLPSGLFRGKHAAEPEDDPREDGLRHRLSESAIALRELYDSVSRAQKEPEENPAAIFDRAAEQVCRGCSLANVCWQTDYSHTYSALNDATASLLRNGQGRGEDFPSYFSARCIRFQSFLAAVNAELRAYLLRRQYRSRLGEARTQAAGQYAQLSEFLSHAAQTPPAAQSAAASPLLPYQIGAALRPREGRRVSGDCMSTFETEAGELCLLLSDGMGSGEEARRESSLAVRLLERFLRAGVDASSALGTLNNAMSLRAQSAEGFTTVDLLTLSLYDLEGNLYKYGAAPSYIKRGGRVRRVSCSCLPAGLQDGTAPPEKTHIRLERGSFFVMVTDGVADSTDDEWLQKLLADWTGDNPQLLVSAILADSFEHRGAGDDAGALALYLPGGEAPAAREV